MAIEDRLPSVAYRPLETEASGRLPLDELGRMRFAENIVKILTSGNIAPPYVFALYGRWGSGKTWVAKQVELMLSWEQFKYSTCWFEAWRYESEDNLMLPLCSAIQKKFGLDVRDIDPTSMAQFEWFLKESRSWILEGLPKVLRWLLEAFTKPGSTWFLGALGAALLVGRILPLTSSVAQTAIDALALLAAVGLIYLSLQLRKNALGGWLDSVDSARTFFSKFIRESLGKNAGKGPLFVFIEDLDRCAPDAALRLIESIKRIALNSSDSLPIVFFLALDRDALVAAIHHRYGPGYGQSWAEDYLQKIVRYSFEVPEVSFQGMTQFFVNRNTEFAFGFDQRHLDQLARICISGRLHNLRKLETVLQRFHLIDSVYNQNNPKYKDFRYRVLIYLLLKEFRPDVHRRIMSENILLPKFIAAAKEGQQAWFTQFAGHALTLEDAKDRDLAGLFHQLAVIEGIDDETQANRIIRYALMIEGVGVKD